ncbi:MAG TPA: hypothetical protein VGG39_24480 [Polyangiaceae bacterium]|jgi:hypothetical protein
MKAMSGGVLFAAVVALAPAAGCTNVLGVTGLPTGTCGAATASDACEFCYYSACCDELTACEEDPSCASLTTCVGTCNGDPSCISGCGNPYSGDVVGEYNASIQCGLSQCSSACSGS